MVLPLSGKSFPCGCILCRDIGSPCFWHQSHQTTKEQLEQIEADIQSIEDYKWSKLRQQKNLMALVFYGSGLLYTVVAILFYFCFLPLSYNLYDKCIYSLPLIVLPAM